MSSSRIAIIKPLANAVLDPFLRYWMPPLESFAEGKANRTVIANMKAIASHIKIDPLYITKYIAIELGCTATYDAHTGRTSIGVRRPSSSLQELIWSFNERYMKCKQCHAPELMIDIIAAALVRVCNTCGYNGGNVTHRVTAYMISHPPRTAANSLKIRSTSSTTSVSVSSIDGIAVPFDAIAAYVTSSSSSSSKTMTASPSVITDVVTTASTTSVSSPAVMVSSSPSSSGTADDDWTDDKDDVKIAKPKKKKTTKVKDITIVDVPLTATQIVMSAWHKALLSSSSSSGPSSSSASSSRGEVKASATTASVTSVDNGGVCAAIAGELKRLQLARSLHDMERINILWQIVTSSAPIVPPMEASSAVSSSSVAIILKSIRANMTIIRACVSSHDGMPLLLSLERFIGTHTLSSSLLPKVSTILQLLYDGDIISESLILTWHTSSLPSLRAAGVASGNGGSQPIDYMPQSTHSTSVRQAAVPFIQWLQQADDDDDE